MFFTFVVFAIVVFPPLLFVAYCRSLLAQASKIDLSEAVLKAMVIRHRTVASSDFHKLHGLVRMCPLGQKDRAPLAAVSAYYSMLTRLHAISSRICEAFADWTERERGRCSYFVAVALDRRIANPRKLLAEQMIQPEKQRKAPSTSSRSQ